MQGLWKIQGISKGFICGLVTYANFNIKLQKCYMQPKSSFFNTCESVMHKVITTFTTKICWCYLFFIRLLHMATCYHAMQGCEAVKMPKHFKLPWRLPLPRILSKGIKKHLKIEPKRPKAMVNRRVVHGTYLSVPFPSHSNLCLSHPIPWDVFHRIPIEIPVPWTSLENRVQKCTKYYTELIRPKCLFTHT